MCAKVLHHMVCIILGQVVPELHELSTYILILTHILSVIFKNFGKCFLSSFGVAAFTMLTSSL